MDVLIRAACLADARVVNEVYDYYIDNTVATFNELHKTVEERENELVSILGMYPFLVAEDEKGAFLGFACAEPFRSQTGYRFIPELTIYLHPSAPKRCGIGTKLYEKLLMLLKAQGFASAVAVVYGGNAESLALHRRFGFEQMALMPNAAYKHGMWLDMCILRKELCGFADCPAEPVPFPHLQNKV